MMKKIFFAAGFFVFLASAGALELTGIESSLGDIFSSSTDPNEGMTVFRSMNIPSGGRTEALGTAFTALADDSSFFDYNPAASAALDKTEIAVYHNAWIADSAMETLALTRRNGRLGYGAQIKCFYVPFSEYNLYGERVTGSYYSESAVTLNAAYNFLAGYSFKGIAVGANTRLAWRSIPDYTDNRDDSVISGSGLEQSALAIMIDSGVLLRLNFLKFYQDRSENLRIALSLNNFGIALTGFGKSVRKDDDTPARISAGIAYRPFPRVTLTGEVRQPVLLSDLSSSGKLTLAGGVEARITQMFAFQLGFLLQGANPRLSMGSEFDIRGVKMDVAYTLDLTSSSNPVNHISLGAKMTFSDRGRKAAMQKVDESYAAGLRLYAAGYYNEAILKWNEAIATAAAKPLSIRFEPAIQARAAAVNFNSRKAELDNMYAIDFDED